MRSSQSTKARLDKVEWQSQRSNFNVSHGFVRKGNVSTDASHSSEKKLQQVVGLFGAVVRLASALSLTFSSSGGTEAASVWDCKFALFS